MVASRHSVSLDTPWAQTRCQRHEDKDLEKDIPPANPEDADDWDSLDAKQRADRLSAYYDALGVPSGNEGDAYILLIPKDRRWYLSVGTFIWRCRCALRRLFHLPED